MGIDFLDFCFRLEKKLSIRLPKEILPSPGPGITIKPLAEMTVADLQALMMPALMKAVEALPHALWTNGELECDRCGRLFVNTTIPGYCRRCGKPLTLEKYVGLVFRICLRDTVMVPLHEIRDDSLLKKDLMFY